MKQGPTRRWSVAHSHLVVASSSESENESKPEQATRAILFFFVLQLPFVVLESDRSPLSAAVAVAVAVALAVAVAVAVAAAAANTLSWALRNQINSTTKRPERLDRTGLKATRAPASQRPAICLVCRWLRTYFQLSTGGDAADGQDKRCKLLGVRFHLLVFASDRSQQLVVQQAVGLPLITGSAAAAHAGSTSPSPDAPCRTTWC